MRQRKRKKIWCKTKKEEEKEWGGKEMGKGGGGGGKGVIGGRGKGSDWREGERERLEGGVEVIGHHSSLCPPARSPFPLSTSCNFQLNLWAVPSPQFGRPLSAPFPPLSPEAFTSSPFPAISLFLPTFRMSPLLVFLTLFFAIFCDFCFAWPDGAPCLRTVYDSMNPLEAVEHQGGLQLSDPPFSIEVDSQCYTAGRPLSVTLRGNGSTEFKGFAMQSLVFDGVGVGKKRTGQFLRMDDNGSWQFQCFRIRDSITHSHDDKKGRITLWWRGDYTGETVQFVATVVQNLKRFWVKSVVSMPIPSCSMRSSFGAWNKGTPTVPPPTDNFKKETFELFNPGSAAQLISEISALPSEGRPRNFPQPPQSQLDSSFLRIPETTTFVATTPSFFRPNQQFQRFGQNSACRDSTSTRHCLQWVQFCPTNPWMGQFCKATCRMC